MAVSTGMAGNNLHKLNDIAACPRSMRLPFVLRGECNVPAKALNAAVWPTSVKAQATPSTGSNIDYFAVSEDMAARGMDARETERASFSRIAQVVSMTDKPRDMHQTILGLPFGFPREVALPQNANRAIEHISGTLLDRGWLPDATDAWREPEADGTFNEWRINDEGPYHDTILAMLLDAGRQSVRKMAKHNGKGPGLGASWRQLRKRHRYPQKKDRAECFSMALCEDGAGTRTRPRPVREGLDAKPLVRATGCRRWKRPSPLLDMPKEYQSKKPMHRVQ